MDNDAIRQNLIHVASEVFSMDKNSVHENMKAGDVESWDSLGHLNLFLAIENRFKVKFSTEEIIGSTSLKEIIDRLQTKLL